MADNMSAEEDQAYKELALNWHHFASWREKLFGGYLAALAALARPAPELLPSGAEAPTAASEHGRDGRSPFAGLSAEALGEGGSACGSEWRAA